MVNLLLPRMWRDFRTFVLFKVPQVKHKLALYPCRPTVHSLQGTVNGLDVKFQPHLKFRFNSSAAATVFGHYRVRAHIQSGTWHLTTSGNIAVCILKYPSLGVLFQSSVKTHKGTKYSVPKGMAGAQGRDDASHTHFFPVMKFQDNRCLFSDFSFHFSIPGIQHSAWHVEGARFFKSINQVWRD